jgi:ABC-type phosphate transport system permease subunit
MTVTLVIEVVGVLLAVPCAVLATVELYERVRKWRGRRGRRRR